MNGNALDNGGGYITYCSHDYVYAPDGQGVLTGEAEWVNYHYRRGLTFGGLKYAQIAEDYNSEQGCQLYG